MSFTLKLAILLGITTLSILFSLTIGSANLSWQTIGQCLVVSCNNELTDALIWQIRLPRIIAAMLAGAGLAAAGTILQNATRNPLADPYLFGIVSGAALGATVANMSAVAPWAITLPLAAFLGALFAVLIVVLIGQRLRQAEHLLLAGVAVSFMLSSVSQFLLYLGDPLATNRVMFWLMGSLARVEMNHIAVMAPVVIISTLVIALFARQLDTLLLSDETAHTLGVNPEKLRLLMLALCAALTATIVAYCGGIGFVGLMIPHIARRFFGVTTLRLLIGSSVLGGCFLLWVDIAARSILSGQEVPIGVITAAIGSLFFLFLLKQRSN